MAQAWGAPAAGVITAVASMAADTTVSWHLGIHRVGLLLVLAIFRLTVYLVCAWLVRNLQKDRERLHLLATADFATGPTTVAASAS